MPIFGTKAKPLACQAKLNEKQPFVGEYVEQDTSEILGNALITLPILAYPHCNITFQILTDTSSHYIGAVLSQIQNGKEVVSYQSKYLKPYELKFAAMDKDALAAIFDINWLKNYYLFI